MRKHRDEVMQTRPLHAKKGQKRTAPHASLMRSRFGIHVAFLLAFIIFAPLPAHAKTNTQAHLAHAYYADATRTLFSPPRPTFAFTLPATLATSPRFALTAGYSIKGEGSTFFTATSIPTPAGTFFAGYAYAYETLAGAGGFTEAHAGTFGYAKRGRYLFTSDDVFAFGTALTVRRGEEEGSNAFSLALDTTLTYTRPRVVLPFITRFGFALAIENAGRPLAFTTDDAPPAYPFALALRMAEETRINRTVALRSELAFSFLPFESLAGNPLYPTLALRSELAIADVFHLFGEYRVGSVFGGRWRAGLDVSFETATAGILLAYTTGERDTGASQTELFHTASLTIRFEKKDTEPPLVTLTADAHHISPNDDGRHDTRTFTSIVTDARTVTRAGFAIVDGEGREVLYAEQTSGRELVTNLSSFFGKLFRIEEGIPLTNAYVWTGRTNGHALPEAYYYATLFAEDEHGNKGRALPVPITLDVTPPDVRVEESGFALFVSKTNRGELIFTNTVLSRDGARFAAVLSRLTGEVVAEIPFSARRSVIRVTGESLPEGSYYYYVASEDAAGNTTNTRPLLFEVVDADFAVSVLADRRGFSPYHARVTFFPSVARKEKIAHWTLIIEHAEGAIARVMKGSATPTHLVWNGDEVTRTPMGEVRTNTARDGRYTYTFECELDNGLVFTTPHRSFFVDGTPPKGTVVPSATLFTPDDDGRDETLFFNLIATDTHRVGAWRLSIYERRGEARFLFLEREGRGIPPATFPWKGESDMGYRVTGATTYEVELRLWDEYENTSVTEPLPVMTGILVIRRNEDALIRLTDIAYEYGSDVIAPASYPVIIQVARHLLDFPSYTFRVEGHTDDKGDARDNESLSLRRAASVKLLLVREGIEEDRIRVIGMGEADPIAGNDTPWGRARNNRIDIVIEKPPPENEGDTIDVISPTNALPLPEDE